MAPGSRPPGDAPFRSRLVVGVDGSPASREALRWASRLARGLAAEIVAVHALGLIETVDGETVSADAHRDEITARMTSDWCACLPDHRTVVRDGNPVDVLADVARDEAATLIVVGRRGTGGAPALELGSTSLQLLRVAPVPVLVIPPREDGGSHLALARVLVAVDDDVLSRRAVGLAATLATAFGASVELVNAVEEVPVFPLGPATRVRVEREVAAPRRARARLEPLRADVAREGLPVHVTVRRGSPEEVLRRVAADIDADLVVLSSSHLGPTVSLLGCSVSRRMVRLAHRPTLVVPEVLSGSAGPPVGGRSGGPAAREVQAAAHQAGGRMLAVGGA